MMKWSSTTTVAGRAVGRVGLGCMGMSFSYGADPASDTPDAVIRTAAELAPPGAAVMLDTADVYGPYTNESLIGQAVVDLDEGAVLVASKGGLVATGQGNRTVPDGRPEHLRRAVDGTLLRLGVDRLDLYYLHRIDPQVPLAESWGALADLVAAGKVSALGLSEVDTNALDLAHAIHPVAAVQSELSLFRRLQLDRVVPWCEERGATFVAYAPLGRGFLTGAINERTTIGQDDFRSRMPLFAADSVKENLPLVDRLRALARDRGATPGQVALAWLQAQSGVIVAIPGTRRALRVRENLGSCDVRLCADEVDQLSALPEPRQPRYAPVTSAPAP